MLLLCPLSLAAEGMFNVGAGIVYPVSDTGHALVDLPGMANLKWGGLGASGDLQYLHKVEEKLFLGIECGASILSDKTQFFSFNYEGRILSATTRTNTYSFSLMLAGRLYFDTASSHPFYVPFGVGVQNSHINIRPTAGYFF